MFVFSCPRNSFGHFRENYLPKYRKNKQVLTFHKFLTKRQNLIACEKAVFRICIHLIRIRIQHFRLNTDPEPDPGCWWPKIWQNLLLTFFLQFLWIKNYKLPIPRLPYRISKLQKKTSALKREHPALQNMKFFNFFLLLWVIFALLDPDPDSESGSTNLIELVEYGSNEDFWKNETSSNKRHFAKIKEDFHFNPCCRQKENVRRRQLPSNLMLQKGYFLVKYWQKMAVIEHYCIFLYCTNLFAVVNQKRQDKAQMNRRNIYMRSKQQIKPAPFHI